MASTKLVQEIGEEFLTCKICFEAFTEPKSLSCLHTFCEKCLDGHLTSQQRFKYGDHREVACPLCRKKTSIPIGGIRKLPDNFLVMSLRDLIGRQRVGKEKLPFCDICKLVHKRIAEASAKCVECSKLLCPKCAETHSKTKVTQSHAVYDLDTEKEIECKEHRDELIRFFCEHCETCICVLCTFTDHKDHDVTSFKEGVSKYRPLITKLLGNAKERIEKLHQQLETVGRCEATLRNCEREISDVATQFCHVIRAKEKALIEELHDIVGTETLDFIERKTEMREMAENLQSTCSLGELVMKGNDLEFLLVKKQLQEKLSPVNNEDIGEVEEEDDGETLPDQLNKRVAFIQGSVSLGYLEVEEGKMKEDNGKHVRFELPNEGGEEDRRSSAEESDASEDTGVVEGEVGGTGVAEEFHDATSEEESLDEEMEDMMEEAGPLLEYKSTQTDQVETNSISVMTDNENSDDEEAKVAPVQTSNKEAQTELSLCMRRRSRPGTETASEQTGNSSTISAAAVVQVQKQVTENNEESDK